MTNAEREALKAAMQLPWPSFPCNELKRPTVKEASRAPGRAPRDGQHVAAQPRRIGRCSDRLGLRL